LDASQNIQPEREDGPEPDGVFGVIGVIVPGLRVQQDGEAVTVEHQPRDQRGQQFSRKGDLIHRLGVRPDDKLAQWFIVLPFDLGAFNYLSKFLKPLQGRAKQTTGGRSTGYSFALKSISLLIEITVSFLKLEPIPLRLSEQIGVLPRYYNRLSVDFRKLFAVFLLLLQLTQADSWNSSAILCALVSDRGE
jgi:hypothetical protein